jgi:hypothetical protein
MPNVSRPVKEVPVLVKKDIETRLFKLIAYKEGKVEYDFELDKKKLLVGSAENCDIKITDPHISHYHALLVVDEHGCKILDLESNNGIWLNGERERNFYFSAGDCIKLGPIEFHVEEILTTVQKGDSHIQDQDHQVAVLDDSHINQIPSELPPVEGLAVIDGEYCDIEFNEENFRPVDHIPAIANAVQVEQFIDTEEEKEVLPIARQSDTLAVEVTVLSNGVALSVDYFPLKDGTYNASPVTDKGHMVHIPCLDTEDNLPFFQISNGHIDFFPLDGFDTINMTNGNKVFNGTDRTQLEQNQVISYNYKTVQVVAKITEAPANLRFAPFFGRDRNFQKQAIQIFSGLMSFMLLLLLVDIEAPKPEKKIAVIYRKAIKSDQKAQNKSSQEVSDVNKDKGVKKEQQSKDKPKFAKAEPNKNKQKKSKQNKQKIAKTAKASAQKQPKKTKVKAYEFKTSKSFNSMFSKSNSVTPTKIQNNTVATTSGFDSSKAASSADLKSKTSVDAGTFGRDFRGNYDSSAGAKGLASKSGIDTSFVEPKTVVLGSMDPELLRKILREYLPQFRHCYQKELERNGNTEGVVDLNFRIMGNGGVSNIKIGMKGAKFSKTGSGCMAGVLKLIDFPKPKGGGVVDVRQPLNFFSEQEKL